MNRRTVMVIDDSTASRMMTQVCIREIHPDWRILEAASPEEALLQVSVDHVDYFSVDLNMQGMNGFELITRLRDHFPSARYALLTSNGQENVEERAAALGIKCVHKPVTDDTVAKMLVAFEL